MCVCVCKRRIGRGLEKKKSLLCTRVSLSLSLSFLGLSAPHSSPGYIARNLPPQKPCDGGGTVPYRDPNYLHCTAGHALFTASPPPPPTVFIILFVHNIVFFFFSVYQLLSFLHNNNNTRSVFVCRVFSTAADNNTARFIRRRRRRRVCRMRIDRLTTRTDVLRFVYTPTGDEEKVTDVFFIV